MLARRAYSYSSVEAVATGAGGPLVAVLFLAAIVRIAWKLYTQFTYEDAFITFRFARNLANGLGFVYNANEPIYGTTTPLFTILMAAWIRVFPNSVVVGATLFGLLAALVAIGLAWKLLTRLTLNTSQALVVTGLLILSDKLWLHDMGGMETPLVIGLMMAAYYLLLRNHLVWAGVFGGLLLWLRLDGAFWLSVLALAGWITPALAKRAGASVTRRFPLRFVAVALGLYLPWCLFAAVYFGSPIPYTIYAKWVAYETPLNWSVLVLRATTVLQWLTPFSLGTLPVSIATALGLITLLFAALGAVAYRRQPWLMVLPAFAMAEFARLVVTGETFETRYFMPLYWSVMILLGLGLCAAGAYLTRQLKLKRPIWLMAAAAYVGVSVWFSFLAAQSNQAVQSVLNQSSREPLGRWLAGHTPTTATVFLEPLGYAGFYANRRMLDAVGLVSPQVVALKRAGYATFALITALAPDDAVLHCDEALNAPDAFLAHYSQVAEFNPLNFDPRTLATTDPNTLSELAQPGLARAACYQVWQRTG